MNILHEFPLHARLERRPREVARPHDDDPAWPNSFVLSGKLSKILFETWTDLQGKLSWSDFEDLLVGVGIEIRYTSDPPEEGIPTNIPGHVCTYILYQYNNISKFVYVYAFIPEELAMKILVLGHLELE